MTLIKRIIRYGEVAFIWHLGTLVVFVIVLCLYIIKPFKSIKLVIIRHERLGHLAADTDVFLRRLKLENAQKRGILYVGISGKPANQQMLKMFKRKFPIIQNEFLHDIFLNKIHRSSFLRKSGICIRPQSDVVNAYYELKNTGTNLSFIISEEEKGRKLLNKMGINDGSWFVCFNCRDSNYLDKYHSYYSRERWSEHDYLDCDINNYVEAAKYIASCGGYAVRMGYGVAKKLPNSNNPRIIDYATCYRTDFGDIYLSAKCKFFLAARTGLFWIPTIFHVPVAMANSIPLAVNLLRKGDLYIPKKLWSIEKKRLLTFREILESELAYCFQTKEYALAEVEVVENTPEEILDLAKEMNERLDGSFKYKEEDEELQKKFQSLFQPHHLCYGSPARIGATFLRQNKELLG